MSHAGDFLRKIYLYESNVTPITATAIATPTEKVESAAMTAEPKAIPTNGIAQPAAHKIPISHTFRPGLEELALLVSDMENSFVVDGNSIVKYGVRSMSST